jgi:threonine dehydrogenase-like Zn-dependent dehydrogenase
MCDRYCAQGFTSRCTHAELLGSPTLPGAQAQYIRIPKAGGTLIPIQVAHSLISNDHVEKEEIIPPEMAILLADILPTGYFAALQAFQHPNLAFLLGGGVAGLVDQTFAEEVVDNSDAKGAHSEGRLMTFAVIGLGPVGVVRAILM